MDANQEIAKLINELGRLIHRERPPEAYSNLTVLNFQLLAYIYFNNTKPTMRQMALTIGISLPSLSAMMDRLEEEGLVVRTHNTSDRRVVQAGLTELGVNLIEAQIQRSTQTLKEALLDFNETEKQIVLRFFNSYIAAAKHSQ